MLCDEYSNKSIRNSSNSALVFTTAESAVTTCSRRNERRICGGCAFVSGFYENISTSAGRFFVRSGVASTAAGF